MSKRPVYATQISEDHSADTDDLGVPTIITIPDGKLQGDRLGQQTIVQYFTGTGFQHFVALLDFEDWGGERCPRYAVYYAVCGQANGWVYYLAQDVAESLVWPGERP